MKALILVALIAISGSASAAPLAAFRGLLTDTKVVELSKKLGMELDEINDASKLPRPRCACYDFKLKFVKKDANMVNVEKVKYTATVEVLDGSVVVRDLKVEVKSDKE